MPSDLGRIPDLSSGLHHGQALTALAPSVAKNFAPRGRGRTSQETDLSLARLPVRLEGPLIHKQRLLTIYPVRTKILSKAKNIM